MRVRFLLFAKQGMSGLLGLWRGLLMVGIFSLCLVILELIYLSYRLKHMQFSTPALPESVMVFNLINASSHTAKRSLREIGNATFSGEMKILKKVNISDARNKASNKLVQYLIQRTYSKAASMEIGTHHVNVVLARSDHFGHRMEKAGISHFDWIDPLAEMMTDLPWVLHTAAWWEYASNSSISSSTLVDMGKRLNYYREFSKEFASGNFLKAAKLMSPFENGVDAWPSVAIIENALVFGEGQIHNGSHIVHGKGCRSGTASLLFNSKGKLRFQIVATIADFWGSGYFHFVAENLVRIPLVLPVIEQIKISMVHVHSKSHFVMSLLEAVGVPGNRVIAGIISADVALLPEPIPCGTPPAILLQLLRRTLLVNNAKFGIHHVLDPSIECKILVVRRKWSRRIINHGDLILKLKNTYKACVVNVHTGEESIVEQMKMFRAASLVIAPHGAGITNILACRKRTLIFEFLIPGAVNICYMAMSFKLQLNYFSMAVVGASHSGAMSVNIDFAMSVLKSKM